MKNETLKDKVLKTLFIVGLAGLVGGFGTIVYNGFKSKSAITLQEDSLYKRNVEYGLYLSLASMMLSTISIRRLYLNELYKEKIK